VREEVFMFDIDVYRTWSGLGGDPFWFRVDSTSADEYNRHDHSTVPTVPNCSHTVPTIWEQLKDVNSPSDSEINTNNNIYNIYNNILFPNTGESERGVDHITHTHDGHHDHMSVPSHSGNLGTVDRGDGTDDGLSPELQNISENTDPNNWEQLGTDGNSGNSSGNSYTKLIQEIVPDDYHQCNTNHRCNQCGQPALFESTDRATHLCQKCMGRAVAAWNKKSGMA